MEAQPTPTDNRMIALNPTAKAIARPPSTEEYAFLNICWILRQTLTVQKIKNKNPGEDLCRDKPYKVYLAVLQNGIPLPKKRLKRAQQPVDLQQYLEEAIENMLRLYRHAQNNSSNCNSVNTPHFETILQVCHEIRSCPNIKIHTLSYFSKKYALSESTLTRSFKKIISLTIHRFVTIECIKKATTLRQQKGMPLEDIAELLGYSDKSGFVRTFKRLTGKST